MSETRPLLGGTNATSQSSIFSKRNVSIAVIVTIAVAVVYSLTNGPAKPVKLEDKITRQNLVAHLQDFSNIAAKYNGSRSVKDGYLASAAYIEERLKQTDYEVTVQHFTFPYFEKYAPGSLQFSGSAGQNLVSGKDFEPFRNSGSGSVKDTPVQGVSGGCKTSDFATFTKGNVALIAREAPVGSAPESCIYREKIKNAYLAGASAVLVYSALPGEGPLAGGTPVEATSLPILGLSHAVALHVLQRLAVDHSLTVSLTSAVRFVDFKTVNVIADTKGGDANNVVVAGSHLDSVPAGPGINDDASGSSATLAVALALYKSGLSKNVVNKVRFAWWSAEELGLIGSNYYVDDLAKNNPDELKRIALNLNNDMIASPNGARFIYNGREAVDPKLRGPSGVIQTIFENYFDSKGLAHEPTEFDGRSDYGGFLRYGIPAGGLFTGAEVIKTEEQAKKFGGTAGIAFDPCYHEKCDTLENIQGLGISLFTELAGSMGHIVQKLAYVKDLRGFLAGGKEETA
ncbi:hypothetical protein HDU79_010593 [Rhizoclosmatium sp. JEL0117]|nr:hypothetical protein HDU79_010593 [Rhizoclosmatium sp. JEL0117]